MGHFCVITGPLGGTLLHYHYHLNGKTETRAEEKRRGSGLDIGQRRFCGNGESSREDVVRVEHGDGKTEGVGPGHRTETVLWKRRIVGTGCRWVGT